MLSITEHTIQIDKLIALRAYLIMIALTVIAFIVLQVWGINESLFFAINEASKDLVSDAVAAHLTELGNGSIVGVLALGLTLKYPAIAKRFLFITLIAGILIAGFKQFFADPRPAGVLAQTDFYIIGDVLKQYSFPSGHTTTAFAMAGFIVLTFSSLPLRILVLMLAVLAGVSRISVGAHWPEDVLAGAVLGLLIAYVGCLLSLKPFSIQGSYCAAAFLALAALIGSLTAPADFPEITTIAYVRLLSAALSIAALAYYSARLSQLYLSKKS
ncbi:MAG: membrane-associated phospholipid phosphatase [Oleispira sp.]|jgi:membrane-associated phospholipid phosphatase